MGKFEAWMGSMLWIAVATLLPMAALEPVAAGEAPAGDAYAISTCEDGGANLAMGCESIHL